MMSNRSSSPSCSDVTNTTPHDFLRTQDGRSDPNERNEKKEKMSSKSRESESDSEANDGSDQRDSQDNSSHQDPPERTQSPPPQVQQLSASQTGQQTVYSESLLSDYKTSTDEKTSDVSNAAISSLIEQKVQHVWNSLGEAQASWMKKQSEMLEKINKLETSEKNLKNQVKQFENQNENVVLNNTELMEKVEEVKEENAGLLNRLNAMEKCKIETRIDEKTKTFEVNLWRLGTLMMVLSLIVTTSLQQSFAETLESNFWKLGIVMLVLCIFVTRSHQQSFAETNESIETLESNLKNEIEQRQKLEMKISKEFTQRRQQIDTERSNEAQKTNESIKALESILRNEIGKKRDKTDAIFTLADQRNGLDFYFGDDKFETRPSIMKSKENEPFSIKSIFQAVDLGLKRINLKFYWKEEIDDVYGKWRVRSPKLKTSEGKILKGENWRLFISNSDKTRKFRATAENIHPNTGNVTSKMEGIVSNSKFSYLWAKIYGQEEIVTANYEGPAGYIRWNIEFLD